MSLTKDTSNFLKANPHYTYTVILVATIIGISLCFFTYKLYQFCAKSQSYFAPLDCTYDIRMSALQSTVIAEDSLKPLIEKAQVLQKYKQHHKLLLLELGKYRYAIYAIIPYLTGLVALLTFIIAQRGWEQSSRYLKALLLTAVFLVSLYTIFPKVFNFDETFASNLNSYIAYHKLQQEVFDFSETYPLVYSKESMTISQFINYLGNQEAKIFNIYFELNESRFDNNTFNNFGL